MQFPGESSGSLPQCFRLIELAPRRRKARLEIQTDHQTFSNNVQMAASQILRAIGCECLTFELLQIDSAGAVAELDNSEWDLRRTSTWRPKTAAPVAGSPVGR